MVGNSDNRDRIGTTGEDWKRELSEVFSARIQFIVFITALIFAGAILVTLFVPPIYSVSGSIIVRAKKPQISPDLLENTDVRVLTVSKEDPVDRIGNPYLQRSHSSRHCSLSCGRKRNPQRFNCVAFVLSLELVVTSKNRQENPGSPQDKAKTGHQYCGGIQCGRGEHGRAKPGTMYEVPECPAR